MKKEKTSGKTGRPKKKDSLKDVYRNVRFTPAEDAALTEKAKQANCSRSDFVRKAVENARVVPVESKETIKNLRDHKTNLGNIGRNLNAIAHRANTEGIQFELNDLQEARDESLKLIKILQEIQSKMM